MLSFYPQLFSTEYSSSKKSGILASQILNATNNIDDGEMNFVLMNLISRFLIMGGQLLNMPVQWVGDPANKRIKIVCPSIETHFTSIY